MIASETNGSVLIAVEELEHSTNAVRAVIRKVDGPGISFTEALAAHDGEDRRPGQDPSMRSEDMRSRRAYPKGKDLVIEMSGNILVEKLVR